MNAKPAAGRTPDSRAGAGSPSGEWSDEQHHVAPEGAQRPVWVAPWSDDVIAHLTRWQSAGWVHPYTCGKRDDHKGWGVLTPTRNGWVCSECDYTQDWAHAFDLPPDPFALAARYHARREDRIAAACWAAEHDPGTEDAWRHGCTCDRDGSVTWGCPLHDPEEE